MTKQLHFREDGPCDKAKAVGEEPYEREERCDRHVCCGSRFRQLKPCRRHTVGRAVCTREILRRQRDVIITHTRGVLSQSVTHGCFSGSNTSKNMPGTSGRLSTCGPSWSEQRGGEPNRNLNLHLTWRQHFREVTNQRITRYSNLASCIRVSELSCSFRGWID